MIHDDVIVARSKKKKSGLAVRIFPVLIISVLIVDYAEPTANLILRGDFFFLAKSRIIFNGDEITAESLHDINEYKAFRILLEGQNANIYFVTFCPISPVVKSIHII